MKRIYKTERNANKLYDYYGSALKRWKRYINHLRETGKLEAGKCYSTEEMDEINIGIVNVPDSLYFVYTPREAPVAVIVGRDELSERHNPIASVIGRKEDIQKLEQVLGLEAENGGN